MSDIFLLPELISEINLGKSFDYLYFWGHTNNQKQINKSCFSQWYPSTFIKNDEIFHNAEQWMMAKKAELFNDSATKELIMHSTDPSHTKKLGRAISNFNASVWDKSKLKVVIEGNLHKFSQNTELKEFLLSTENKILVEASPYDNIWGVGMNQNDSDIQNPNLWKGENLLGFALMHVRSLLKDSEDKPSSILENSLV